MDDEYISSVLREVYGDDAIDSTMGGRKTLVDISRIGGVSEVAVELGVLKNQVTRWVDRRDSNGFPDPIRQLTAAWIYDLDEVSRWHESYSRTRRRRNGDKATKAK